jgi:hypothetical protein
MAKQTVLMFKGKGPFSLPPIERLRVAMTESKGCLITGRLPMTEDRTERFVEVNLSLESAMQLLGLLQKFQQIYGLPMPTGPIETRQFQ